MKRFLYLFLVVMMNIQYCMAQDAAAADISHALKNSTSEPSFFSIFTSLLVVIFLIYITGVIYTKLNLAGANVVKEHLKNHDISKAVVVSTTQLGQNKNLHVIEINNQRMLIGSTPESISLIRDLGSKTVKENNIIETIKEKIATESIEEKIEEKTEDQIVDEAINLLYDEEKQTPLMDKIDKGELPRKREKVSYMEEEFTLHKKYL